MWVSMDSKKFKIAENFKEPSLPTFVGWGPIHPQKIVDGEGSLKISDILNFFESIYI